MKDGQRQARLACLSLVCVQKANTLALMKWNVGNRRRDALRLPRSETTWRGIPFVSTRRAVGILSLSGGRVSEADLTVAPVRQSGGHVSTGSEPHRTGTPW